MRPTFSITANGNDITSTVSSRLVSLEVVDTVDETSDGMTLALEDALGTLALPKSGATIEVSIGYDGINTRLGSFVVDDVEIAGPPDIVTVTGSSTPFVDGKDGQKASFTSRKSRSWDQKTIGDIVSTIAGECGLSPVVDKTLKDITIPHIDQVGESDANLLIRLARRYGGVLKPADGRLVFAAEKGGQSTSGQEIGTVIMRNQVANYRVRLGGKSQGVTKVRARVHNYQTGTSEEVDVEVEKPQFGGDGAGGENIREIQTTARTREEAEAAAKTAAKRIERSKASIQLTMAGTLSVVAGAHMTLVGFRDGINGKWKAVSVRQTLSRSGWLTAISGEAAQ
jgi:phage protein D